MFSDRLKGIWQGLKNGIISRLRRPQDDAVTTLLRFEKIEWLAARPSLH